MSVRIFPFFGDLVSWFCLIIRLKKACETARFTCLPCTSLPITSVGSGDCCTRWTHTCMNILAMGDYWVGNGWLENLIILPSPNNTLTCSWGDDVTKREPLHITQKADYTSFKYVIFTHFKATSHGVPEMVHFLPKERILLMILFAKKMSLVK